MTYSYTNVTPCSAHRKSKNMKIMFEKVEQLVTVSIY